MYKEIIAMTCYKKNCLKKQTIPYIIKKYRDELELLNAAFNLSEVGLTVTDSSGTVLRTNVAHSHITGRKYGTLIGRNMRDVAEEGHFSSAVIRVIETGRHVKDEQNHYNGRSYFVYSVPYFTSKGELEYIVSNLVDTQEISLVKQELEEIRKSEEKFKKKVIKLKEMTNWQNELVFCSENMQDVIDVCDKIAQFDTSVLICGESGTGKELLANYIFQKSSRSNAPFIKINCSAIPESLLESELFGYESGAFTNANSKGKKGILEIANEGTILLDEVGDMPLQLQPKILRFLQEGEMFRVGGNIPIKSDVRIIAATHCKLDDLVKQGKFRGDLYYRLNVIPIQVPSLEERKEDILPLVRFFTKNLNEKYGLKKEFDYGVIEHFMNRSFPGNVRELRNVVERLMMLSERNVIKLGEVLFLLDKEEYRLSGNNDISLKNYMENYEKKILENYLSEYKTTQKMSEMLKVSQATISRKLSYYNIELYKNE